MEGLLRHGDRGGRLVLVSRELVTALTMARPGRPTLLEADLPVRELSLLAAADRRSMDPVYGVHRWWARRPPAIMRGIVLAAALSADAPIDEFWSAFASTDAALAGLRVHDPFAGGGSTLVEAARLGAAVSGGDVDPLAVEIVQHELSPAPAEDVRAVGEQLLAFLRECYADLYPDDEAGRVPLHYFWLHEVTCPQCDESGLLYRNLVLARDAGKPGAVVRDDPLIVFCPEDLSVHGLRHLDRRELRYLGRRWPLARGTFVAGRYVCSSCGRKSSHRELATGIAPRRLVAVEATVENGYRQFRAGRQADDHAAVARASAHLAHDSRLQLPIGRLSTDRHDDRPVSFGIETVAELFTNRQLVVFGAAVAWLRSAQLDVPLTRAMSLAISNALATNNKLCGYATDYGRLSALFSVRGFPLPALTVELNPLHPGSGRGTLRQCIERVARSASATVRRHVWSAHERAVRPMEMSFQAGGRDTGDIRVAGAADHSDGPQTDLCVFDPPYYDYIAYSELSEFYRAWGDQPTVVGSSLLPYSEDPAEQFGLDFAHCLRAAMRRLADGCLLAFTYHSSNPNAWRAIGVALDDAKLAVTGIWPLRSDGHMGHHSHPGNCEWDLVVCCRRITETAPADLTASVTGWIKTVAPLKVSESDKANMTLAHAMAHERFASPTSDGGVMRDS
jgi:putative DNA methylase